MRGMSGQKEITSSPACAGEPHTSTKRARQLRKANYTGFRPSATEDRKASGRGFPAQPSLFCTPLRCLCGRFYLTILKRERANVIDETPGNLQSLSSDRIS